MKRPYLIRSLTAFVLIAITGLSALEAQEKELQLAFITCSRDARFFVPVKKGMNDAAGMMGVRCDWLGTEGVDLEAQALLLQQAVREGYDGIALNIIDPEAFDKVIKEAMEAGVPVVAFNVDDHATPNSRLSSVNQQLYEAGKRLGEHVSSRIAEGSHIFRPPDPLSRDQLITASVSQT